MTTTNGTKDCALVVGGVSSGALYAKEFARRGISPVHIPAAAQPPAAYSSQALAPEFIADLPFDQHVEGVVDRLNREPLRSYCPRLVVAGTDQAVERADRLGELLGLASNGSALSETRRDKFLSAETLREAGLNAPLQFRSGDPSEAAAWSASHVEIRCWVVKPIRSAGSDRVFQCHTPTQVEAAARRIVGGTNVFGECDEQFLVQEFLTCSADANEYVVNTCSAIDINTGESVHRVVSIYRYEKIALNGAPFVYYARHLLPAVGETQQQLSEYFLRCIKALGVRVGPCHGELRMTNRGPAAVEINVGRPDGGGVPQLDRSCTGFDQVSATADGFLDPSLFARDARRPYRLQKYGMLAFLPSMRESTLIGVPGQEAIQSLPSYLNHVFLARPGDKVSRTVDVGTLIGWVFLCHRDRNQLKKDYLFLRNLEKTCLFQFS